MPPTTARELLAAAENSGLLTKAEVGRISAEFDTARIVSASAAAERLSENDRLTRFQAEQLLAGSGHECLLAGRYRILDKLGEGGMGTVYKAADARLDRTVAIKVLPSQALADPDAVARFEREAKALAKLAHPNIIQAHDVGEDQGRHFVVMEYVDGENLQRVILERGPLAAARAADYIHQAALGLQHAHEMGLVHRDLKPSNLIVTRQRQIKIVDLGLARFFQDQLGDSQLTKAGIGMGTPDYMPPEQFRDARTADPRADIYSLGCTFFHLLSGQVPFPGTSLADKCRAHEERPPPLEESCPDAPSGLLEIVRRMMAKSPAARFQSAREVAEALAPYVAGASATGRQVQATASWQSVSALPAKPSQKKGRRILAIVLCIACIGALVVALASIFGGSALENAGLNVSDAGLSGATSATPAPGDTKVLTVSKSPDDGGEFRTLAAALDRVRPNMTVRVLDDGVYEESVNLALPSRHSGITLESPKGALWTVTNSHVPALRIAGVSNVTVRGFRFRADASKLVIVAIQGRSPGALIENCEFAPGTAGDYDAFSAYDLNLSGDDRPVVIQRCYVRSPQNGLMVMGMTLDFQRPNLCARVVFRDNRVTNPIGRGVMMYGNVREVLVVGNRLEGNTLGGGSIQFEHLKDASDLLIANNTFFETSESVIRVWDDGVQGERIEIVNNLALAAGTPDMVFINSGGSQVNPVGPGDVSALRQRWRISHNWRETTAPVGDNDMDRSWIPAEPPDVLQQPIAVHSRMPDDPNFLRPAADSPLATQGAGRDSPDLPSYIGALPPPGTKPWDWDVTWNARRRADAPTAE